MHKLYWINYVDFINWPYLYEHHTLQTVSCNSLSVQFTHFDFKSFTDSDKACDLTVLKRIHINQNKNTHERAHTPCNVYTIKMLQFSTVFTRSLSLPVQWWKLQWNILWSMKPIINSIINCIPFIATVLASVSRYPALSPCWIYSVYDSTVSASRIFQWMFEKKGWHLTNSCLVYVES